MKTLAVMCMAFTRQSPSRIPLSRMADSTSPVMFTNSMRAGMLKVRVFRYCFMGSGGAAWESSSSGRRAKGLRSDRLSDPRDLVQVIVAVGVELERGAGDAGPAGLEVDDIVGNPLDEGHGLCLIAAQAVQELRDGGVRREHRTQLPSARDGGVVDRRPPPADRLVEPALEHALGNREMGEHLGDGPLVGPLGDIRHILGQPLNRFP